jgi:hypothetical protein
MELLVVLTRQDLDDLRAGRDEFVEICNVMGVTVMSLPGRLGMVAGR